MSSVAVIGAGAWGTALAIQAARAGNDVSLWARDPHRARTIAASRENPRLPGVRLPEPILVTRRAARRRRRRPAGGADAAPARRAGAACRSGSRRWWSAPRAWSRRRCACRWRSSANVRPGTPAAVLTGPNFAHEIAAGLPAAAVVAAGDAGLREAVAALLGTPSFRLYGNDDPIGAQVGGAAKNVVAIAAGAVIGAGLGENARAALITRGLAELARLAVALGGRPETVMGLSGSRRPAADLHRCRPAATTASGWHLGRGESAGRRAGGAQRGDRGRGHGACPGRACARAWTCRSARRSRRCWPGASTLSEAIAALLARPRRDE